MVARTRHIHMRALRDKADGAPIDGYSVDRARAGASRPGPVRS